jgi:hypothetical protein
VSRKPLLIWLALLVAAAGLGIVEGNSPAIPAPRDSPSLRITIAADGALRLQAFDGTDRSVESPFAVDSRRRYAIMRDVGASLRRLVRAEDGSGRAPLTLEVVADATTPFRMAAWLVMAVSDPTDYLKGRPRCWFSFVVRGTRVTSVPYEGPITADNFGGTPFPFGPVPMAKLRVYASANDMSSDVRAVAARVNGHVADGGEILWPDGLEAGDWKPIEPHQEAVRRWIETASDRPADLLGVVDLRDAHEDVPYGAVLDILRGFVDAGLPYVISYQVGH